MLFPAGLALAARKEFWDSKDAAAWSGSEKQMLLERSPWARAGAVGIAKDEKKRKTLGYGRNGKLGGDMPDMRQATPPGTVKSVPIGEPIPPVPNPDPGHPLEFPVLARWETAKPVRLAGGPAVPEMTGQFYVIRLIGLPLMPPPNSNEGMLQQIKQGSRLLRKDKPPIYCDHLFVGSGDTANQVLLFFSKADPITLADKEITLDSLFIPFQLTMNFRLKDMVYRGELAL